MALKLAKDYVSVDDKKAKPKVYKPKRLLNMKEASRALGQTDSFFSNMKKTNREQFDFIVRLGDKDLVKGYKAFRALVNETSDEICEMMLDLKGLQKTKWFSEEIGLNRNTLTYMGRSAKAKKAKSLDALFNMRDVLKKYNEWRNK